MNTTQTANSFIMPPETATRMLCEPKNRMTAKMRKRCRTARETAVLSKQPILKRDGKYVYAVGRSKTGEEKLTGKLKGKKWTQLLIWEKRLAARIRNLTKLADSLEGLKEEITAMKLRERIAHLHAIGNLLQVEIDTRG